MRDAAQAKAALQGMQDAVKAESAAEVAGATQAAAARQKDITAIQQETQALSQLANSAKQSNTQLLYGGRNDMTQHLSDLASELNYTTLLNRQKWLGFSSVQQAMSYRQQMYNLALLENKAHFAGYLTADQYLGFLQRETMQTASLSAAIRDRTSAISSETSALLAHANALQGTHQTIGGLGEQLGAASAFATALTGLPAVVHTRAELDTTPAMAALAAYRAALTGLPHAERLDITTAATRLGGVPLGGIREQVPVTLRPNINVAAVNQMLSRAAQSITPQPLAIPASAGSAGEGLTGAADDVSALDAAMSSLSAQSAVSADALRQFGDSAMLAQVDTRALEAGLSRLSAAEQMMSALKPRTEDWFDLVDIKRAATTGAISNAPGGYPTPAAGMNIVSHPQVQLQGGQQTEATLDKIAVQMQWLDDEDSKPRLELEGGPEVLAETAALDGALDGLEKDRVIHVDGSGAVISVEEFVRAFEEVPAEVTTEAEFGDDDAKRSMDSFVGELIAAARTKYEFYAGMNDDEVLDDLNAIQDKMLTTEEQGKALLSLLGQGGASGGGGGGGPPSGAAGYGPDPEDDDLWRSLAGAIQNTDDNLKNYTDDQRAARAAEPNPSDRAAYDALGAAINGVGSLYRSAANGQKSFNSELGGMADPAAKAAAALNADTDAFTSMGWRLNLLRKQITLWSGLFGTTEFIGQVALWHVALDSIIEVLALWIPALATAGAGLIGFAAAGAQSAIQVGQRWLDLKDIGTALGTTISPLTDGFSKLQAAVRPQVYELFGDYLTAASGKAGPFNTLILQTGNYIDRLGARIVVAMQSGGSGLSDFFQAGEKDLALIGKGFDSLGTILLKFLQATAITHIAEDLAAVGDAILGVVADIVKLVPTPVLAVVLALHGIILWGGLATDAIGKVVIGVASLTGKLQSLNGVSMAVAQALGATDAQLVKIGTHSAEVEAVTEALGGKATEQEVSQLAVAIGKEAESVEAYVGAYASSGARLAEFSEGLDTAGTKAVALGIAAGATDEQLAGMAAKLGGTAEAAEGLEAGAGDAAVAVGGGGGLLGMLGKLSPVLGNVWVDLGLASAALIGFGVYLGLRADQTKQFTDALGAAVTKASLFTVVGTTVTNLAAATTALGRAQSTGAGNATELAASQSDLSGKLGEELTHVGDVSHAYGTTFVGALSLLNAAGVTTSQLFSSQNGVWATAEQQVKGLVAGYEAMGQRLGPIGSDLNVLTLSTSAQATSMNTLNSAYDSWTKTVGGAPSAFISMAQGFATFNTDAKSAGATMTGLSAASLTLQGDFQSNYSNVESLFDAFRDDQALTGAGDFTKFVKDAVAALIPMAGGSKEAASQISALAQEAGGPATTNIKTLQQWVGNIKNPLLAMQSASNKAAEGASNLSQDAQRLTSTLQGLLNPAMANALFNAHGGQKVFSDWADALAKSGPNSKATATATKSVATELLAVSGSTANAKANFVGFAESAGLTSKQADSLWATATTHMTANLSHVRKGLADTASVQASLGSPGLWGQVEHVFMAAWDGVFDWFKNSVPHAFESVWDGIFDWFSQSVPHAFGTVWNNTWRDVAAPVVRAFDAVTSWVASNFDPWWKTHGEAVEQVWHEAWSTMEGVATGTFKFVENGLTGFWNFVTGLFTSGLAKGVWTGFQESGVQAWQWIKTAADGVMTVITSWWPSIEKAAGTAADIVSFIFKGAWATVTAIAKITWDTIVTIISVALDLITGHWAQAWADIKTGALQVWNAIAQFFTTEFNAIVALALQLWAKWFDPAWSTFYAKVGAPLANFFTNTVEGWWDNLSSKWTSLWSTAWSHFNSAIVTPLDHFFTGDIPTWFTDLTSDASKAWNSVWSGFSTHVLSPLQTVFTSDFPKWWNDVTAGAAKAWSSAWTGFNNDLLQPIEKFFTTTLPSAMWNSLKGGIDHVISGLNTVIGWINSVTSVVGVHINTIPSLAHGGGVPMASGSVPGTGDEDGTHILAMGGEYMLRKPARMALQSRFGPDFLDDLNHADTWLGAGSRGNAASQKQSAGGRYASGGGILGDVGNWLGGAVSAVGNAAGDVWSGITDAAKDVASFGMQTVFNGMWDISALPAEKAMEALGTPGDMGAAWLQDVHGSIETWIAAKTAAAKAAAAPAGGGVTLKPTGSGATIQALMQSMAASVGWTGAQWTDLNNVEEREAGYSLTAQNPTSGAYGLAQFIDGASEYAQYGGNASTAAGQITAMLNYIKDRYGTPAAAWAHELAYGWYSGGGPVVTAIQAASSNKEEQEAMALGSYLLTKWNATGSDTTRDEYGAFLVNLGKHKGFTQAEAQNPVQAAQLMAPYYAKGILGSTPASWKSSPATAALNAYASASTAAGTHWSTPSASTLADAWDAVQTALGPAITTTTSAAPTGDVNAYQAAAAKVPADWEAALGPWHTLSALAQPKGVSAANWKAWLAQRAVVNDRVATATSYFAPVDASLKNNPQVLTAAEWSTTDSSVSRWQQAMDVATWAKGSEPALYSSVQNNLTKMLTDTVTAANAWEGIWGTQLAPGVGSGGGAVNPGGTNNPGGAGTPGAGSGTAGGTGATIIDLAPLIIGGPASPGGGDTGFNLAAGGPVGLSGMAGMFTGGMAAGGVVPNLFVPGLSANLSRQLSAATSGQLPRTLSDAAGNRVGLHIDQLNISNPVAEKPSDSITRSSNRLSFLAGRGTILCT
jgi:hypothetical protein